METFNDPHPARQGALEELQAIDETNNDLWLPHPSDSPIRRHPFAVGGWVLIACAAVAFNMTYGLDDGWVGWLSQFLFLAYLGGSVAAERWFLRDRGLKLAWFPPGRIYKKQAKLLWPVIVLTFLVVPVVLFWLLEKPFWVTFPTLISLMVPILGFGDYWYRKSYPAVHQ